MENENIYIRQTGLIDPALLTQKILIVGAGSIGGWTALCLGKLGCQDLTVMDFDTAEIHNAGSQVYKVIDDGMLKVDALKERLGFLLEKEIKTINAKWTPEEDMTPYEIVIAAVDNITARADMFHKLAGTKTFYIDARMAGNAIEIYPVFCDNEKSCEFYEQTLFSEDETLPVPCSERSVVYNVFVIGGMIGDIVARYANKKELPRELIIDLANFTMYK